MTMTRSTTATVEEIDGLVGRIFGAVLGAMEAATIVVGQQVGLYAALEASPGQRPEELAATTNLSSRYVREWLQSQAISGFVVVEDDDIDDGTYRLAPAVAEALLDETSPAYVGALPPLPSIVGRVLPDLIAAFRTGAGVPYGAYGPEAVAVQEGMNRPAFEHSLVAEWLPALPEVLARLSDATTPARVVDACCGAGWSSIRLAEAFPHVRIDGFDADESSVIRARANSAQRGVDDRVRFEVLDVSSATLPAATYDLAFVFEAIHDLARPLKALHNLRTWLAPDGVLVVMDENVAEELSTPSDEVERFMAAASVLWCTPQGMGPDSEVIGAVMRPARFTELASAAGFGQVRVAPIEHQFFRFYELRS
jgi:predicted O-methyltransferase YrrM